MRDVWFALRMVLAGWSLALFCRFWPAGDRASGIAVMALLIEFEKQRALLRARLGMKP